MLFKNQKSLAQRSNRMGLKLAALLFSSLVMMPVTGVLLQKTAAASDLENIGSVAESDGHFVRLGLHKSVVIRLPADAHDVIVGNPEIVDAVVRSKNTAYLFARGIGQTNIFFFDKGGQQILNLDLEVATDMTALRHLMDRSIPGNKITVDSVNNSIVLGGTAAAPEAKFAEEIARKFITRMVPNIPEANSETSWVINTIKIIGEDQVMLKVRIVEVQRSVLKQFGVRSSGPAFRRKICVQSRQPYPGWRRYRRDHAEYRLQGRLYRWFNHHSRRHTRHGAGRRLENAG